MLTAQNYAWLLGAQVLVGIGIAAHHPLLSQTRSEDTRGRAFSIHCITGAIGDGATPAISAGAGLCLLSLALLAPVVREDATRNLPDPPSPANGIHTFARNL